MTDEKNDRRIREIMRKVRERVRKRGLRIPDSSEHYADYISYKKDIKHLVEKADVRTERLITSHRRIIGTPLVKARKFLHEEIMRATGPATARQVDFNRSVAYALVNLQKRIERLSTANTRKFRQIDARSSARKTKKTAAEQERQ